MEDNDIFSKLDKFYLRLDLFLDPPTTNFDQLEIELKKKIKEWNKKQNANPRYKYCAQIAQLLLKQKNHKSIDSFLKTQAELARNKKEKDGKETVQLYESNDRHITPEEYEKLIEDYKTYFTTQTINSWLRSASTATESISQPIPKEPQYPSDVKQKIVTKNEMDTLADDLLIFLGDESASLYDFLKLELPQINNREIVEKKTLELYNIVLQKPKTGLDSAQVDAEQRLLGKAKIYFKTDAAKRGYDIALKRRPFDNLIDKKFSKRIIKGFITYDDYQISIVETCNSGLPQNEAEWYVYDYYCNKKGLQLPPKPIEIEKSNDPPNVANSSDSQTNSQKITSSQSDQSYPSLSNNNLFSRLKNIFSQIYNSYYEFRRRKGVKADFPLGKSAAQTENSSVNSLKNAKPFDIRRPITLWQKLQNFCSQVMDNFIIRNEKLTAGEHCGERFVLYVSGIRDVLELPLRWCPIGEFVMGSPKSEIGHSDIELQRKIRLVKGFWMLETPVTQEMWLEIMNNTPAHFKGAKRPVECVTWNDCQEFIKRLNKRSQKTLRSTNFTFALPTETQWEYACRAGTETAFNCGNEITNNANFKSKETTNVGEFPPNAWGLFDMHGNVWEWCEDRFGDYLIGKSTSNSVVESLHHAHRGGCWRVDAISCRSATRAGSDPQYKNFSIGFRIVLRQSK
jgi:formylglycine-generating enzyme required for sulfatase activity